MVTFMGGQATPTQTSHLFPYQLGPLETFFLPNMISVILACALLQAPLQQNFPRENSLPNLPADPLSLVALSTGEVLVGYRDGSIVSINPRSGADVNVLGADKRKPSRFTKLESPCWDLREDPRAQFLAASGPAGQVLLLAIHHLPDENGSFALLAPDSAPLAVRVAQTEREYRSRFLWTKSGEFLVTWAPNFLWNHAERAMEVWTRGGEPVCVGPLAQDVAVHPRKDLLAVVGEGEFWLVDPIGKRQRFEGVGAAGAVSFSPDGSELLVGFDKEVRIMDAENGTPLASIMLPDFLGYRYYLSQIDWAPNRKWFGFGTMEVLHSGVIDLEQRRLLWYSDFEGGMMGGYFRVGWTRANLLLSGGSGERATEPVSGERTFGQSHFGSIAAVCHPKDSPLDVVIWGEALLGMDPMTGDIRWRRVWKGSR